MITDMIPNEILGVYDRHRGDFMSVLQAAVLTESRFSMLPEIVDVFGDDALKFLEVFSGRVIDVPPIKSLVDKMQQVSIWILMETARRKKLSEDDAVDQISNKFRIRKVDVWRIDEAMTELMKHMALELRLRDGQEEDNEEEDH